MNAVLCFCLLLSGAAALALEALWMRSVGLILGQTAETTAMVLACYFAGLGLGSMWSRREVRRPVRAYAQLEIAAAAGAMWSFVILQALANPNAWIARVVDIAPLRIIAVVGAILPAAVCLGATLPRLAQALVRQGNAGVGGGLLYALNIAGGAFGLAAAGFGLPAYISVRGTYAAAAATSALAGLLALAAARYELPAARGESRHHSGSRTRARLRIVAAATGALGLGLEVVWTRLFAQILHNSIYSFTAIALIFLVALALGAAAAAVWLRSVHPATLTGGALIAAAVTTVVGVRSLVWLTDGLAYIGMRSDLGEYVRRVLALAAISVGPTAFASGIVLPSLWAAWDARDGTARPLGELSAANTVGGIFGALIAGFVAIPRIGIAGSLLVAAVAYLILAARVAPRRAWRVLSYASAAALLFTDPTRIALVHLRDTEALRAIEEGTLGIVSVVDTNDDRQLRLDNYYVLGGTAAALGERRLGLLPLLLHPEPRRVAFIGLATGISASAAPALGVGDTTVVELIPEVASAARRYFADANGGLLEQADVHVIIDDGRRYLSAPGPRFDVIISDLFVPWHAGTSSLYAREMYEAVARRMASDGIFCQWLPLYQLTREEFDTIVHTFLTVFPHTSLWRADFYPDRPVVGLVARLAPQPIELDRVAIRVAGLPAWAHDPLLAAPRGLVMLAAGNLTPAADLFAGAPINTDNRPLIEFLAPRLTRIGATGDKDWFTGAPLANFYDALADRNRDQTAALFADIDEAGPAQEAGRLLYRYAIAAADHDDATAAKLEAEVRRRVPEVVETAESTPVSRQLADARRNLSALQAEEERVRQRVEEVERRLAALIQPSQETP